MLKVGTKTYHGCGVHNSSADSLDECHCVHEDFAALGMLLSLVGLGLGSSLQKVHDFARSQVGLHFLAVDLGKLNHSLLNLP